MHSAQQYNKLSKINREQEEEGENVTWEGMNLVRIIIMLYNW